MRPSFKFMKRVPSSASATKAAMIFIILHRVNMVPFRQIGWPFLGNQPRKKCPDAWLRAHALERYEASEWIFRIMSDTRKGIVTSGWVAS